VAGQTELPDDEHVERRTECSRHFEAHRNAAARERQDDNVVPAGEVLETLGQQGASFLSISKPNRPPGYIKPIHGAIRQCN
jgi:hypothetical protein